MHTSLIVAVSRNGVIGSAGHLPWHLKDDLRRFRRITTGHSVVMGRKNYESIGHPLPDRANYVISHNPAYYAPDCVVCTSVDEALYMSYGDGETECFIIGGASIYAMALEYADRAYVTRVDADIDGDVLMPDLGDNWTVMPDGSHEADQDNDYPAKYELWIRNESWQMYYPAVAECAIDIGDHEGTSDLRKN